MKIFVVPLPTLYASAVLLTAFAAMLPTVASAQDAAPSSAAPHKGIGVMTPSGPAPSLFVLNAGGATLVDGKLTLNDVAKQAIVFADRPVRAAGHIMTDQFILQWGEGNGSFAVDPPNGTISVLGDDGSLVSDAVIVLTHPALQDDALTFDVAVLEGSIAGAGGPAALFIDRGGGGGRGGDGGDRGDGGGWGGGDDARGDPGGFDADRGWDGNDGVDRSYWQAPALHGAWYQHGYSADDGYATQDGNPYLYCGHYPYPPCN